MIVATLARIAARWPPPRASCRVSRTTLWRMMKKHQITADAFPE